MKEKIVGNEWISKKIAQFAIFLLVFLLSACVMEVVPDIVEEEPEVPTGELVLVNFSLREAGYGAKEIVTPSVRRGSPTLSEGGAGEGIYFPVTNDLYMYVELIENEPPVKLRATELLDDGTYVRVVAYRESTPGSGDFSVNAGYADYYVVNNGLNIEPVENPLMLPPETYKFVGYSYNTTSMPAFLENTSPLDQVMMNHDVLWGNAIESIIGADFPVHITLEHLLARIIVEAAFDPAAVISSFNLSTPSIDAYHTSLNVQSGVITPVGAMQRVGISRSTILPGISSNWYSDLLHVYTNFANSDTTLLRFNNLQINGITYPGPFETFYLKRIFPGHSYTLYVTFLTMFSYADILYIADDGTLSVGRWKDGVINPPGSPKNMLYFKFGSVIGFTEPTSGNQWNSSLIKFNPSTRNSITLYNDGNQQGNHNGVPCYSQQADWNNGTNAIKNVSIPPYHTRTNVQTNGKGDPCRLVGLKANDIRTMTQPTFDLHYNNSHWRLPTAKENIDFVRTPESWNGVLTNPSPSLSNSSAAYWAPYDGQNGGWFPIPGERNAQIRPIRNMNPNGFLPTTGGYIRQINSGVFNGIGSGIYWSGEIQVAQNAFYLRFDQQSLFVLNDTGMTSDFNNAYAIRCVYIGPSQIPFPVSGVYEKPWENDSDPDIPNRDVWY